MALEPWTITTVYPDGRTEERLATPEEVAQREADTAAAEAQRVAEEQAKAEREAARASALAKLKALGLTADEVAAIVP
jgi:vacuolar-type H+-ATPase subunit E/Vma4